jgi:hypothetical protein
MQKPTVREMVLEAVKALGGDTTNGEVKDWILRKYPGTNPRTIQCHIIACTVNHPSRVHYAYNQKPRPATGPYDGLYRPESGRVQLYDPHRHGHWLLAQAEDGRIQVREGAEASEGTSSDADEKSQPGDRGFVAEAHLRDYLARHLDRIEPGMELYIDEENGSRTGVEFKTPVGIIDLLAIDKHGRFVVIELKVSHGPDSVAGQVLRYKNWVAKNMAQGIPVRGIIVAQHVSDKILYALASDPQVTAKEYEINLTLKDVANMSA